MEWVKMERGASAPDSFGGNNMKTRTLFMLINALLVLVVGLVFGIALGSYIWNDGACISAFIVLLLTLCLPSVIYLVGKNMTTGGRVISIVFMLFELATCIVFLTKPSIGVNAFWIAEAIVIGVYLAGLLAIIALFHSDKAQE